MKSLLMGLILLVVTTTALADNSKTVNELQSRWVKIKYEMPENQQEKAYGALVVEAEQSHADNISNPEFLIWEGVIRASYAGEKGGLGALSEVKKAKILFERAIEIDPAALDGSAFTSLGSLYYQVPGWPIGFGSSKKANEMLLKGLKYNPEGVESNFFYGEYLMDEGEYKAALDIFEKALQYPVRADRSITDNGLKKEIKVLIAKLKHKLLRS